MTMTTTMMMIMMITATTMTVINVKTPVCTISGVIVLVENESEVLLITSPGKAESMNIE